jgi:uncharacterized protein YpmS
MKPFMTNRWKLYFYCLLTLNLIILLSVLILIFQSTGSSPNYKMDNPILHSESEFVITTNKDDLNQTVNHYLQKTLQGNPLNYSVSLDDDVRLAGTIQAFGRNIQMEISFNPVVLANGDLLLETNSMHIGALPVPVKRALDFMKNHYTIPSWVSIQPKEERIYISLAKIDLKSDFRVRANEFNLTDNRIEFLVFAPVTS